MNSVPYLGMQNQIGQQQDLANVMRLSSLQPINNVSSHPGSELSWTQVLAKALEAYGGHKAGENARGLQQQLANKQMQDTQDGMTTLMEGMQSGDKTKALMEAMAHPSPAVQGVAKQMLKGVITDKDLAKAATNESLIASKGNINQLIGKKDLKTLTPGAPVIDESGTMVVPNAAPGAAPTQEMIGGDMYQRSPTGLDQINKAPRVTNTSNVSVNMPAGETEFDKTLGKSQAKVLSDALGTREMQVDGLNATKKGLELLEKGIHSGALANLAQGLDKASIAVFKTDPEKAARTEQFISHIGDIVIPGLKAFGGSDTVEEMKYLQRISAGDITMEPTAMKEVLKSIDTKIRRKIANGDKAVEAYKSRGLSLPTLDDGVKSELPEPHKPSSSGGSGGKMSLDDYLKSKGY